MLFHTLKVKDLVLKNRVVMSPLTRSRADIDNSPNELMALYYAQRASAGLIITEGTSPSPNGVGYPRMPALFNERHAKAWRVVTDAVHERNGKIFLQLMHTGRVAHIDNLPSGAEVLSPTADALPGEMYTDKAGGTLPHSPPRAMNHSDIQQAVQEHSNAAKLAIEAGFDGVEVHAANGYLIEQFLNGNVNTRMDSYGGSHSGRNRFALEVIRAVVDSVGAKNVGVRLSPHGALNSTGTYSGVDEQYLSLVEALSEIDLLYIHVLDHSAMGAPEVPAATKATLRRAFRGTFIAAGGFDEQTAETAIQQGYADLVAFGRPFISNPDLVERMQARAPMNELDMSTLYTPGPKGYTDYPTLA